MSRKTTSDAPADLQYPGVAVLGVGVLGEAVLGVGVLQHQYEITLNTALVHTKRLK